MSVTWTSIPELAGRELTDIHYEKSSGEGGSPSGIAKITIARPEVRNAFRPRTVIEISQALEDAREDTAVGVIVLTGEGPDAFCSGGDQRVRGDSGYLNDDEAGTAQASGASTSPTCTSRSAGCPSRWWRWSRAMRSAAGTCCTSCAT